MGDVRCLYRRFWYIYLYEEKERERSVGSVRSLYQRLWYIYLYKENKEEEGWEMRDIYTSICNNVWTLGDRIRERDVNGQQFTL